MGDARLLSGGRVDFAAGRGYDRKEYEPFQAPFDQSADLFAEGLEIVLARLDRDRQVEPQGQVLRVQGRRGAAEASAAAAAALRRLLSRGPRWSWPPQRLERDLRALRGRHGLRLAGRCGARLLARPARRFKRPMRRAMCSYFVHLAATPAEEQYGTAGAGCAIFQDAQIGRLPPLVIGREVLARRTYKVLRASFVNILREHAAGEADRQCRSCAVQPAAHRRYPLRRFEAAVIAEVIPLFQLRPEVPMRS
jgi:alkanesulfonate monooxygenase SsuD/methylene tetrahydromethanopterin reductase-like flavin-dependent oxidoreductase (luciferase family)